MSLFKLVDSRCEKVLTIYTSNLTFDKWTGIFDEAPTKVGIFPQYKYPEALER